MPSQHLFGFGELHLPDTEIEYVTLSFKGNKYLAILRQMLTALRLSMKGYDIIFDSIAILDRGMGMLKKWKVVKQKYICVMHHPPFHKRLTMCDYNAAVFLDEVAFHNVWNQYPQWRDKLYLNVWGPDLTFYAKCVEKYNYEKQNKLNFISNGKTQRDHDLLVSASAGVDAEVIIVTDKNHVPGNYNGQPNITLHYQNAPNDVEMTKLLNTCAVMIIPTFRSENRLGPIGDTSFMDALALGMALIVADNSVMSTLVKQYDMGFVYEAGNEESLRGCMQAYINNPSLVHEKGRHAREYAEKVNMQSYSDKISDIILKVAHE